MTIARVAYFDPTDTGGGLNFSDSVHQLSMQTHPGQGVMVTVGQYQVGIDKALLPVVARYFLAACVRLGIDPNDGWDQPQQKLIMP